MSFHQKPEHLRIPLASVTQLVDPSVQFGLQFNVEMPKPAIDPSAPVVEGEDEAGPNVVSLDAFRKKN
jgi:hypothetical protein